MEQTINVIPNSDGELIIRTGSAIKIPEPEKITISGVINSPFKWLEKRVDTIDQKEAFIIVDRESKTIILYTDELNTYGIIIKGSLSFSKIFTELGINSGKSYDTFSLAKFFRMRRTLFESQEKAMEMISVLKNFEAKINKDVEKIADSKGNYSSKKIQAVESNIPDGVMLTLPIFNGMDSETIEIEFDIDPNNLNVSLVSPQASDLIQNVLDEIIDVQITNIQEIAPYIPIIEQ